MYDFKKISDDDFFNCQLRGANSVVNAVCGEKDFSYIPADVLKRAGERGTTIHECIEAQLNNKSFVEPLEYLPYWEQFEKWRDERCEITDVIGTEIKIISENLGFKGIIDCIGKFKPLDEEGKEFIALVDWKTSSNLDLFRTKCQLQLYYKLLCEEYPEIAKQIEQLRVLSLTRTSYRWFRFDFDTELGKSLLYIYNHYLRKEAEKHHQNYK